MTQLPSSSIGWGVFPTPPPLINDPEDPSVILENLLDRKARAAEFIGDASQDGCQLAEARGGGHGR